MSVFVSWRGADRAVKDELVAKLRSELGPDEIVWESDEGCMSNPYKEFIEQIHKSEVFIVIVSDDAMKPSYVLNEVIEAHNCEMNGTLNMLVYKITDSPYTPDFAANLNHLSDANHVARMRGGSGFDTLATRVKELLAKRRRGEPENAYDTFQPEIEGTALSRSGYFVPNSRDLIFDRFDEAFERSNIIFATQISGYGRKSAVREYVLQRMSEYKKVVVLHFFSGSLRDFFTTGLNIVNVSSDLFEKLNENETILRKARLLEKLGRDTLIIVPDVTPDERDDRFVFDALAKLGCRVIFVAQTAPRRIRDVFPTVSVDRLENEHLLELFFNYYEASPYDRDELAPVLIDFFNSVDGHTKSVEITATTIAEEFGVYPEDVPGILENIRIDGSNELSERIFALISNLFEVTTFSDAEQNILQAAAHFARIPIEEKTFVEMLKESGIYDAAALRSLVERRWVNNDREARTISAEPFLAEVCLAKMPRNEPLLGKCLKHLSDDNDTNITLLNFGTVTLELRRLRQFFDIIRFPEMSRLLEIECEMLDYRSELSANAAQVEELQKKANERLQGLASSELRDPIEDLLDTVLMAIRPMMLMSDPAFRSGRSSLNAAFVSFGFDENLLNAISEALADEQFPELLTPMRELFQAIISGDLGMIIPTFISFSQWLRKEYDSTDEMPVSGEQFLFMLGTRLVEITRPFPYVSLQVCREWYALHLHLRFYSASSAYLCAVQYLKLLHSAEIYDEEFDNAFALVRTALDMCRKEFFNTQTEAAESEVGQSITYGYGLIARGDLSDAVALYDAMLKVRPVTDAIRRALPDFANGISNAFIKAGDTDAALEFLEHVFAGYAPDMPPPSEEESDDLIEARRYLEDLRNTYEALSTPYVAESFSNDPADYENYYKTYANSFSDRRLLRQYTAIADRAASLDYSGLSEAELRDAVQRLKARAAASERWGALAPEAFALVSEAGFRTLGYRHHPVQYMGGAAIADGRIAEIQNGEGKTYTIILAAFLHSLYGRQVHIIDSSLYLAERNFAWMRGALEYLGCRVGLLTEKNSASDYHSLLDCDIIYATAGGIIFNRQNYENDLKVDRALRLDVAIVDEAEQLLVSEGGGSYYTPGSSVDRNDGRLAVLAAKVVSKLTRADEPRYFTYYPSTGGITLKNDIFELVERETGIVLSTLQPDEQTFLRSALLAGLYTTLYYEKDKNYFVVDGRIKLENKTDGTFTDMNAIYSFFLSKREGLNFDMKQFDVKPVKNTYIVREFLAHFDLLSGTTATASSMEKELRQIYNLDVVPIPPHVAIRRRDYPPEVYLTETAKYDRIVRLIAEKQRTGQPVLAITESIYDSARLGGLLDKFGVPYTLLNAKNAEQEAALLERAGNRGVVTVATAIANRGVDIRLGGNPVSLAKKHLVEAGFDTDKVDAASAGVRDETGELDGIREKLAALTSLYKQKTDEERAYINKLGGLCVIATSCFNDLRLEQQARGRCGRQGDAGESYVFFAYEDSGLKVLLGDQIETQRQMLQRLNMDVDAPISSGFLNKAIASARHRIQEKTFKGLRQLPEMLYRPDARKEILGLAHDLYHGTCSVDSAIHRYFSSLQRNIDAVAAHAAGRDSGNAEVSLLVSELQFTEQQLSEVRKKDIPAFLTKAYVDFCKSRPTIGNNLGIALAIFIQKYWSRYLTAMTLEKANASTIFSNNTKKYEQHLKSFSANLCASLIENVAAKTLLFYGNKISVALGDSVSEPFMPRTAPASTANPNKISPAVTGEDAARSEQPQTQPADGTSPSEQSPPQAPDNIPPNEQSQPQTAGKISPNAPCPCGSGLKYKHCHGHPANSENDGD